jgi:hypothetical protein
MLSSKGKVVDTSSKKGACQKNLVSEQSNMKTMVSIKPIFEKTWSLFSTLLHCLEMIYLAKCSFKLFDAILT